MDTILWSICADNKIKNKQKRSSLQMSNATRKYATQSSNQPLTCMLIRLLTTLPVVFYILGGNRLNLFSLEHLNCT